VFEKRSSTGANLLHFVFSFKCTANKDGLVASRELVKILLKACPQSARETHQGQLPLHMAIDKGWPCHDLLLSVFPEALNAPDAQTDLFPFQTAARADADSPLISLDVTFELLRANPSHARCIVEENARVGAHA